jgi:hypothetical protein
LHTSGESARDEHSEADVGLPSSSVTLEMPEPRLSAPRLKELVCSVTRLS